MSSEDSRRDDAWTRYAAFLRIPPELTIAWTDPVTGARAWLIANSQRGGAFGGGTRMRPGVHPREVVYLAKAMELKFAIAGPPIAGAKTGIDFDPADPRKRGVLERWYRAIAPVLRDRYGTGGDFGVDEVLDVLPAFERLGLGHPQTGVIRGHLRPADEDFPGIVRRMEQGVSAALASHWTLEGSGFVVADVITGFGVAAAVRRYHERTGRGLDGVRVVIEGFGNVGAACALYLARAGARIVGIGDARSVLIEPEGLSAAEVEDLLRRRTDKLLPRDDPRAAARTDDDILADTPADVFVCAALSGSLTDARLARLAKSGVSVIASGANQPFREAKIGSVRVARAADRRFAVLPDILANCGMARTFSYLLESGAEPCCAPIFECVERTIADTLDEVLDRTADGRDIMAGTLEVALDRIER